VHRSEDGAAMVGWCINLREGTTHAVVVFGTSTGEGGCVGLWVTLLWWPRGGREEAHIHVGA
jgi:hypothetical protein